MARGFTDKSGTFRPTDNSSGTSSREKTLETSGTVIKKQKNLDIENPLGESSSIRKQEAMLQKLGFPEMELSNREIDWIKNTMNRESEPAESSDFADAIQEKLAENEDGYAIDEQANEKGEEFLKRKPIFERVLGQREQAVVEDFKEFRLFEFFDSGNQFVTFYVPHWRAVANDGSSFEYYFSGGEVHITG